MDTFFVLNDYNWNVNENSRDFILNVEWREVKILHYLDISHKQFAEPVL